MSEPTSENLLRALFHAQQQEMRVKLGTAAVHRHPSAKGDQSELNWARLLEDHLPQRYFVLSKATAVDYEGGSSDEIDILIIDRQYSPLVFRSDARTYVPAEAIYAALECKQGLDKDNCDYAAGKVASVRGLKRTSAPITHILGVSDPRPPGRILAGLLTNRVDWRSGLGEPFTQALAAQPVQGRLDLGCALDVAGWFVDYPLDGNLRVTRSVAQDEALVFFLLTLLEQLQGLGTVTAMDFGAWRAWISTVSS